MQCTSNSASVRALCIALCKANRKATAAEVFHLPDELLNDLSKKCSQSDELLDDLSKKCSRSDELLDDLSKKLSRSESRGVFQKLCTLL